MSNHQPNPALEDLKVLEGEWEVGSPQFPGARGQARFEWMDGGAFLVQRSLAPEPAPDSTWIFGSDDAADSHTVLYYDERGVSRVYRASLRESTWRVWRDAPGFSQRFTGSLSGDSGAIEGAWEWSADGISWTHDFDLTYRKAGGRQP